MNPNKSPIRPRLKNRTIGDSINLPLPNGMREAIDEARHEDETRVAFIRAAIEHELARRRLVS